MSEQSTTVQDMYDLARRQAHAFTRRPLHDARVKHPYGEPVQATDIVATLPHLVDTARYTARTYLLYATGPGTSRLTGFRHRLSQLDAALEKLPLRAAGTPVPELANACRYLNVGADLVRSTMPYAPTGPDSTRAHAVDTALGEYADVLHTLTGSVYDKLRPAARSVAPTDLMRALDRVLIGTARLRDLPADPNLRQIAELAVAPSRSATVHATMNRWLTQAAPALGARVENLTGATTDLSWSITQNRPAPSMNSAPSHYDARGSSFTLRGIAQTAMVVNRAGMHLVKAAHDQAHLTRPEAATALEAMNRAGTAWADAARHWDATVKVPGANPSTGRHHLEGILSATRSLNTVLRPLANGDQDALRAMTGSRQDLRRTVSLVQHLDATLDRLAFAHHRLVDRLADSGQLLTPSTARTAGYLPGRIGPTRWASATSTDPGVKALVDSTRTLAQAAEQSTEATGGLRLQAPTQRGRTSVPATMHLPKIGRTSTRASGTNLDR